MRSLYTNDFEAANIEYIEFWMLNPFEQTEARPEDKSGGYLYFNLGNVSEDITKDEFTFFENGLPIDSNDARIEYTNLAKVPLDPPLIDGFDNDRESREKQDLGLDGMNDVEEKVFFSDFVNPASRQSPE